MGSSEPSRPVTAMHLAMALDSTQGNQILGMLIDYGAYPDFPDQNGKKPIDVVCQDVAYSRSEHAEQNKAAILALFQFDTIVQVSNLFATLCTLLQWVALLALRYYSPNLHRPYRIPLDMRGLLVFVAFPVIMTGINLLVVNWMTWVVSGACMLFVLILWILTEKTTYLDICCDTIGEQHSRSASFSAIFRNNSNSDKPP